MKLADRNTTAGIGIAIVAHSIAEPTAIATALAVAAAEEVR